jgi:type III secretion protein V
MGGFGTGSSEARLPWQDASGGLFVAALAVFLVVPLPGFVLDLALAAALAAAALLLAFVWDAPRPAALTRLPSALLAFALLRLGLGVAVTRALLTNGEAGRIVDALGAALAGEAPVAGLLLFGALAAVQSQVIARGAERSAQVAARFALDALPGRQLGLDADARAGAADHHTTRRARAALGRESALLGALDGTMRFVRGETSATWVFLGVNLVGGTIVGATVQARPLAEAGADALRFAVGAGLALQVGGLLAAAAAAVWVTRIAAGEDTPPHGTGPAVLRPTALAAVGATCLAIAALPGMAPAPWLGTAAALLAAGVARALAERRAPHRSVPARLELRLPMADADALVAAGHPVALWRGVAGRLQATDALALPTACVVGDADMARETWALRLDGVVIGRGALEPATAVAEALAVPVAALLRRTPNAVLDLDTLRERVDVLAVAAPVLVATVVPRVVDLPGLLRLVAALMAEGIPTADLRGILDVLAHQLPSLDDDTRLRALRRGLAGRITQTIAPEGSVAVLCLDAAFEERLLRAGAPAPQALDSLFEDLGAALASHPAAALLVSPEARLGLRRAVESRFPALAVISAEELLPATRVTPVAVVGL